MKISRKMPWLALAAVAVVIVICWVARPVSDPTYEGKRLSVWFERLHYSATTTQEERQKARQAFEEMGEAAIPLLVDRLQARDPRWKKQYEQFYFNSARRLPRWIVARLPAPQAGRAEWGRMNAATLLGLLGDRAESAVLDLAAALEDESRSVQSSVAQALRGLGPVARESLPTIIEVLHSLDPYTAHNAAGVIVSIGQGAPEATELVAPLLKEEDKLKIRALGVLSKVGSNAKSVEGDIESLLASGNASVRFAAITALWDISPSRHVQLVPRFEEFANRTDIELRELGPYMSPPRSPPGSELREVIGIRLAGMQPLTVRGAELLGLLLEEGNDDFFWRVLTTLGRRGQEAVAAIPVVTKVLEHDNPRVAAKTAEVLGLIAVGEPEVIAALQSAARHPQKMVRDAAEESLRKFGSSNE